MGYAESVSMFLSLEQDQSHQEMQIQIDSLWWTCTLPHLIQKQCYWLPYLLMVELFHKIYWNLGAHHSHFHKGLRVLKFILPANSIYHSKKRAPT